MDFLASAGVKMCFVSAGTNTALHCSYVINGEDIVSDASLGSPFAFLAFLIDPLILQVPDAASNFSGTFSGSSITGNLSITEVPGTLPADISTVIAPSRYQADDRGFPESAAIPDEHLGLAVADRGDGLVRRVPIAPSLS